MIPISVVIFNVCQVAASAYAAWRGGAPERWVAGILIMAALVTAALPWDWARSYRDVNLGLLAVDAVLFMVLTGIACITDRFWPMWTASVQLLTVVSHGLRAYDRDAVPRAYWFLSANSAYLILLMLVAGTWRHRDRLARGMPDEQ